MVFQKYQKYFSVTSGKVSGIRTCDKHKFTGVLNPHSQEIVDLRGLLSLSGMLAFAREEAGSATRLHVFCTSSNSSPGSAPATQLIRIRPAVWSNGFQLHV